jgi:hypothetical protein
MRLMAFNDNAEMKGSLNTLDVGVVLVQASGSDTHLSHGFLVRYHTQNVE